MHTCLSTQAHTVHALLLCHGLFYGSDDMFVFLRAYLLASNTAWFLLCGHSSPYPLGLPLSTSLLRDLALRLAKGRKILIEEREELFLNVDLSLLRRKWGELKWKDIRESQSVFIYACGHCTLAWPSRLESFPFIFTLSHTCTHL